MRKTAGPVVWEIDGRNSFTLTYRHTEYSTRTKRFIAFERIKPVKSGL
jgi:hypothetical protein